MVVFFCVVSAISDEAQSAALLLIFLFNGHLSIDFNFRSSTFYSHHLTYALQVIVKFEDDEDEQGRNPARRVPARFVLRRSDVEDSNDESDDED